MKKRIKPAYDRVEKQFVAEVVEALQMLILYLPALASMFGTRQKRSPSFFIWWFSKQLIKSSFFYLQKTMQNMLFKTQYLCFLVSQPKRLSPQFENHFCNLDFKFFYCIFQSTSLSSSPNVSRSTDHFLLFYPEIRLLSQFYEWITSNRWLKAVLLHS